MSTLDATGVAKRARLEWSALILMVMAFLFYRGYHLALTEELVMWFDTAAYTLVTMSPVRSADFWFSRQTPIYPLLIIYFILPVGVVEQGQWWLAKMLSFQPGVIFGLEESWSFGFVLDNVDVVSLALAQFLISVSCWVIFALVVSRAFQQVRIRILVVFSMLLMGCETSISLWDRHLMTESLSMGLLLLLFAFMFHVRKVLASGPIVLLLIIILGMFALLRITNAYFVLSFLPLLLLVAWGGQARVRLLALWVIATSVALVLFNQYAIFKAERGKFPMQSLVASRISTSGFEDIYQYFREQGMPEIPEFFETMYWNAPYEDHPEINAWLGQAPSVYQRFLLTHPGYFFFKPFQKTNDRNKPVYEILTPDLKYYEISEQSVWNLFFSDLFLWLGSGLVVVLVLSPRRRTAWSDPELLPPVLILAGSAGMMILVWHGDLVDIDRHAMVFALGLRVGLLALIFRLLDVQQSAVMPDFPRTSPLASPVTRA